MRILQLFALLSLSVVSLCATAGDLAKVYDALEVGDYSTATTVLSPLAQGGDSGAQFILGVMHQYGQGIPQDHTTARKWLLKSAVQGNHSAEYSLGVMYEKEDELGGGTPQDYNEAVKWYSLAAESGDVDAQMSLGKIFSNALVDDKKAVKWYERAAKQGDAKAQFYLGLRYYKGAGLLSDFIRSYMWFNLSGYNGLSTASKAKHVVMSDMTSSQIAKAQEMSSICLQSNYKNC